jgi:predicted amidohydrolase
MRCGSEPEENFKRAIQFIRDAASKARRSFVLPEFPVTCQTEDHKNFELAEEVPAIDIGIGRGRRETGVVIVASLFEKRRRRYHNTARIIDAHGKCSNIKDTFDDPLYHEVFIYAGDLQFSGMDDRAGKIGVWGLLGPMVRKRRG